MTDPTKLEIDIEDLTLGEVEEFEEASGGATVSDINRGNVPARAITALVWVFKKRGDASFTLDNARALKLSDLHFAEENPTEGDS